MGMWIFTSIDELPGIMRARGWPHGARLMETWQSRRASASPDYTAPSVNDIRMQWVLGYERAQEQYQDVIDSHLWMTDKAKREIVKDLSERGLFSDRRRAFSWPSGAGDKVHPHHVQTRTLGDSYQELDDLTAALGKFAFHCVVGGYVEPATHQPKITVETGRSCTVTLISRYRIVVERVGVYVKDSYDFEGFQYLGTWDSGDNSVSKYNIFSGRVLYNADFRVWRLFTGRGGDFLVFSDVKEVVLDEPDEFVWSMLMPTSINVSCEGSPRSTPASPGAR